MWPVFTGWPLFEYDLNTGWTVFWLFELMVCYNTVLERIAFILHAL